MGGSRKGGTYVAGADVLLRADVVVDDFEEEAGFFRDELNEGLEAGLVEVCGRVSSLAYRISVDGDRPDPTRDGSAATMV